jgi:anaphase-promoting complex subunit 3
MSPTNPHIALQLRQLVYYHLDNDLLQNALFLAGRLHGLEPRSAEAAHLLALCNLRLGRLKAAYDYSREKGLRGMHLGCAYVFAQACLALERYADGIGALDRARGLWAGRNHFGGFSRPIVNKRPGLT